MAQPLAVVPHLARDGGSTERRPGWACLEPGPTGLGAAHSGTAVTVPIGEFTDNDSGSVVVWDSVAAAALFDALRSDAPIPQSVLDAQP